jgi:hypothetical protein
MSKRTLSRRNFLVGAGGVILGLPALESFGAPCLPEAGCIGPKRFILFHSPQGTVLDQWRPQGDELAFALPEILSPLKSFKKDCLFIGGVDNVARNLMTVGDGHVTANRSLFTGLGFASETVDTSQLSFAGPSIDQVIATRIQNDAPLRSLNVGISAGDAGNSYVQSPFFSNGFNDPVSLIADPMTVYLKYFAGGEGDLEAAAALLSRRKSVLDAVLDNFKHLNARVSQADQVILEAHANKVFELEQQLILIEEKKEACGGVQAPDSPEGYEFWSHEWEPTTAALHFDLIVYALSCGLTNTATIDFRKLNGPSFPWLWDEFGGPLVPTNKYDNWHGMVHTGRNIDGNETPEPGLIRGYKWYAEMFKLLLQKLNAAPGAFGESLLDSTLTMWGTEYGDGKGHVTTDLPVVLAGRVGPQKMGRYLDYFDKEAKGKHCVNEVYVALLQAFGQSDTAFGNHMDCPTGPLPGILD